MMNSIDVYPVTVRGPIGVVTFARIFTHDNRLYVAETRDKGRTIYRVSVWEKPDADMRQHGRKTGKWGPWRWSSCGCVNKWGNHTVTELAAQSE